MKTALVTGASRGFGAAAAEVLAANGYHVIALARTVGALEELDDRIVASGGTATLVPLDICDDDGLKRLCVSIHERWGGLDFWLHTAIFAGPLSPVNHVPLNDWQKVLATNIRATQRLITMIEPLLRMKSGTAMLPTQDDIIGTKFMASHGAAKAAQQALWASWAAENSAQNTPDILTFTPNPMPTALRARFYPGEDREVLSKPMAEAARMIEMLQQRLG